MKIILIKYCHDNIKILFLIFISFYFIFMKIILRRYCHDDIKIFFFSGILTLQIFSKTDLMLFGIGCLLTIAALLYIELKQKSIRPVYPVICLQIQGFIWVALRLENDQKFYEDFKELSSDKILYIWFMQLFSINCAWFMHLFLKWLQKVISIYYLDENSTSIVMFRYVTDRELIEKLVISCLNSFMKRYIIKIKKFLTETRTKNSCLLLQTVLLFIFLLMAIFFVVSFFGLLGLQAYQLVREYENYSKTDIQIAVFLFASFYGLFAVAITVIMAWFTVKLITELFKQTKYFLIFLIVFSAYYCVVSNALYILGFIFPFDKTNAIYVLISFVFFSFTYIKMIISILWKRKQAIINYKCQMHQHRLILIQGLKKI